MSLVINTNTQSLFAQRALSKNTNNLKSSIERLSTGYKINKAADDSAGLSISEKLHSQIRGLEKAKQNAGDGISMVQTAEGALSIIQDNLQRIRELVVQAKNQTNGPSELDSIQREINERVSGIDSIAKATKFNGKDIIYDNDGGTSDNVLIQVGADDNQTLTLGFRSENNADEGIDIDITEVVGGSDDEGHIIEGVASALSLDRMHITGATVNSLNYATHTTNVAINLTDMDKIISNVSRMRSYLGAVQNSLESRIEYLDVAIENNSASRSRINDVDVAKESSNMLKNQILQQSAASMLTQANSTPQLALNLLP
jgi:flagellin